MATDESTGPGLVDRSPTNPYPFQFIVATLSKLSTAPSPGTSRTFKIGAIVLLCLGVGEVFAVIWGLASKRSASGLVTSTEVRSSLPPNQNSSALAGISATATTPPATPATPYNFPPAPAPTYNPPAPAPLPAPATRPLSSSGASGGELLLPEQYQINDIVVLETIADGVRLRSDGDTQGALEKFRAAAGAIGDNPVILAEIARTYEVMGLRDKAIDQWERIFAMGENGAGDFHVLADVRLRGLIPGGAAQRGNTIVLGFDPIVRDPMREGRDGSQTVMHRIPIKRIGDGAIVPDNVSVYIYFYDRVNGERIAQSTADPPQYNWRTLPIDWGTVDPEIFEVVYHHPALTPEQVRELGQREYCGYVAKLYYNDRLQDLVAEPRLLLDYAPATTLPQIDDILFRFDGQ